MANVYIMTAAPGAGKTTFIKEHLQSNQMHVSRDEIRFSMVPEGEEYFSKENQVFEEFVKQINNALDEDIDVYVDATHLNVNSRRKIINRLQSGHKINSIWIKTPLDVCLERNEKRKGTRAYVPRSVISKMYHQIQKPTFEEGFDKIYIIEPDKKIQILVEG